MTKNESPSSKSKIRSDMMKVVEAVNIYLDLLIPLIQENTWFLISYKRTG